MAIAPEYSQPKAAPTKISMFSKESDSTPTVQVPMRVINRPLPSELDEAKVEQFIRDIKAGDEFTPIEVLRVDAPDGQKYYFSLGGCHRYEAHKRLGSETLPGRIISVPPSAMRVYLGAGCPF